MEDVAPFFIVFPFIFVGFWSFVLFILSRCGWSKLASRYQTSTRPAGTTFGMESLRIGMFMGYNNCLTMTVSEKGLFVRPWLIFRLAHKPLLIPWSEFRNPQVTSMLFYKMVPYEIGEPRFSKVTLSQKVIRASPLAKDLPS